MRKKSSWITAVLISFFIFTWPGLAFAMESRSNADLKGIDVSHWDGTIHWKQVAASHIQFAYIKATGGNKFVDPQFKTNVTNARASGIAVGAYHYAKPTTPFRSGEPIQQANLFVRTMRSSMGGFGDVMPVLDLEETGRLSPSDLVQWIRVFVSTVEHQTNRKVMLYTSVDFIQRHSDLNSRLSNIPLWVAYYDRLNGGGDPPDIAGWSQWMIWQYTDQGRVTGLSGSADLNAGPTSLSALRGYLSLDEKAAQGPESAANAQSNVTPIPSILPTNTIVTQPGAIPNTVPTAHDKVLTDRHPVVFLALGILLLLEIISIRCVLVARKRETFTRSNPASFSVQLSK